MESSTVVTACVLMRHTHLLPMITAAPCVPWVNKSVLFFSGSIQKEHLIWFYRWHVQHLNTRVGDVIISINNANNASL